MKEQERQLAEEEAQADKEERERILEDEAAAAREAVRLMEDLERQLAVEEAQTDKEERGHIFEEEAALAREADSPEEEWGSLMVEQRGFTEDRGGEDELSNEDWENSVKIAN